MGDTVHSTHKTMGCGSSVQPKEPSKEPSKGDNAAAPADGAASGSAEPELKGVWDAEIKAKVEAKAKENAGKVQKILFLIRHGEGDHNVAVGARHKTTLPKDDPGYAAEFEEVEKKNEARQLMYEDPNFFDSHLSAHGEQQCKDLKAAQCDKIPWDCVLVSPLYRTLQTAQFCLGGEKKVPWIAVDQIREYGCGGFHPCDSRMTREELEKEECFMKVGGGGGINWDNVPPGEDMHGKPPETDEQLQERTKAFMEIVKNRPEKFIAVVGHSAWLKNFTSKYCMDYWGIGNHGNPDPDAPVFDNCELKACVLHL